MNVSVQTWSVAPGVFITVAPGMEIRSVIAQTMLVEVRTTTLNAKTCRHCDKEHPAHIFSCEKVN